MVGTSSFGPAGPGTTVPKNCDPWSAGVGYRTGFAGDATHGICRDPGTSSFPLRISPRPHCKGTDEPLNATSVKNNLTIPRQPPSGKLPWYTSDRLHLRPARQGTTSLIVDFDHAFADLRYRQLDWTAAGSLDNCFQHLVGKRVERKRARCWSLFVPQTTVWSACSHPMRFSCLCPAHVRTSQISERISSCHCWSYAPKTARAYKGYVAASTSALCRLCPTRTQLRLAELSLTAPASARYQPGS